MKIRRSTHHDKADRHLRDAETLLAAARDCVDFAEAANLRAQLHHSSMIEQHEEQLSVANKRYVAIRSLGKALTYHPTHA